VAHARHLTSLIWASLAAFSEGVLLAPRRQELAEHLAYALVSIDDRLVRGLQARDWSGLVCAMAALVRSPDLTPCTSASLVSTLSMCVNGAPSSGHTPGSAIHTLLFLAQCGENGVRAPGLLEAIGCPSTLEPQSTVAAMHGLAAGVECISLNDSQRQVYCKFTSRLLETVTAMSKQGALRLGDLNDCAVSSLLLSSFGDGLHGTTLPLALQQDSAHLLEALVRQFCGGTTSQDSCTVEAAIPLEIDMVLVGLRFGIDTSLQRLRLPTFPRHARFVLA